MKSSTARPARRLRDRASAPAAALPAFPTSPGRYEACPSIPPGSLSTALVGDAARSFAPSRVRHDSASAPPLKRRAGEMPSPESSSRRGSMQTALDTVDRLVRAINAGDLKTALGLYEPDAVLVVRPGQLARGWAQL